MMHTRIGQEVKENPEANVCYILVSHGATIDCAATSFQLFEEDPSTRPSFESGFTEDQRKVVLDLFTKDKYNYGHPHFCSFSGFQSNKDLTQTDYVFKRFNEHTKDFKGAWDTKSKVVNL